MRWVILTDDYPPCSGGIAVWTRQIANGLAARGYEVVVYARARDGTPPDPFEVVQVQGRSFGRHGGKWTAVRALPRIRPEDRVLATTWNIVAPLAKQYAARAQLHVVGHGSDVTDLSVRQLKAALQVWDAAHHRWAMSGYLAARMPSGTQVLPAPVELLSNALGPRPDVWACVARATPLKGVDRFLRLVAAAGTRAVVIGDVLPEWRTLAAELGLADRVRFTGAVEHPDAMGELSGCEAVFLLSKPRENGGGAEGLGLCLLEGAARAVVPVGCQTGGIPEAVGPGLVLTDPDDVAASVAEIRRGLTPGLGARCQAWVRRRHGTSRAVDSLVNAATGSRLASFGQ